jgi:hypothetical protein
MEYLAVLLPSVVVGLIFWFAMKSIFNADKAERQAEARAQAEADAIAFGSAAAGSTAAGSASAGSNPDVPVKEVGDDQPGTARGV